MEVTTQLMFSTKTQQLNMFDILHDKIVEIDTGFAKSTKTDNFNCYDTGIARCEILCGRREKPRFHNTPEDILVDNRKSLIFDQNIITKNFIRPRRYCWPMYSPGNVIKGGILISGLNDDISKCKLDVKVRLLKTTLIQNSSVYQKAECEHVDIVKSYKLWSKEDSLTEMILCQDATPNDATLKMMVPFQIALPSNVESSLQPLGSAEETVSQFYTIISSVEVSDPGNRSSSVTDSRGVWVTPSRSSQLSVVPLVVEKQFPTGVFGKAGDISCLVSLPKQDFAPNKDVSLNLEVRNGSRQPVESIHANILLLGRFDLSTSLSNSIRCIEFEYETEKVNTDGIGPGQKRTYDMYVPISFDPKDLSFCVLPVPGNRIPGSSLDFQYSVIITLVRGWSRRNFNICVPVNIMQESLRY